MKIIKWGIIGTGWIAHMFAANNSIVPGSELYAVTGTSLKKAETFKNNHNLSKAYSSIGEMLNDSEIDAVYIGTPHPAHYECIVASLRAGKHVLCTKPITMNASQLQDCISLANANNLMLMDAMWPRFKPEYLETRRLIQEGAIGKIVRIEAHNNFRPEYDESSRLFDIKLGGGAMLDMGIYPLSFAFYFLGGAPENIYVSSHLGRTGVDLSCNILMEYTDGVSMLFSTSIESDERQDITIFGTDGEICIPNALEGNHAELNLYNGESRKILPPPQDVDFLERHHYIIDAFCQCLRDGKTSHELMPLDESLHIMQAVDEIIKQAGIDYLV